VTTISATEFIEQSGEGLLLDVRSEKEFEHAHIPGAINIPLLNNEHRHLVGIEYKQNGNEAAVELGFKLVGPKFHEFIAQVNTIKKGNEIFIYCWRGGMRSNIMAWILSMAGNRVTLLKGGYKAFRRVILQTLTKKKQIQIVGGHTGCGKTEILSELKKCGEAIVDLEALANHRGSAFGNLGLPSQPSNEYFENLLGLEWMKIKDNQVVWMEAESRSIGVVKVPDSVFDQMQCATLFEVLSPVDRRKKRILDEYGVFSKKELSECTIKVRKRLGAVRLAEALIALDEGRMNDWLDILIEYYDKTYSYSLSERKPSKRIQLETTIDETSLSIAKRLIELSIKENKLIA
jgi:tRNA 2-selenouridine synthase